MKLPADLVPDTALYSFLWASTQFETGLSLFLDGLRAYFAQERSNKLDGENSCACIGEMRLTIFVIDKLDDGLAATVA